jgi:hypothetical protein
MKPISWSQAPPILKRDGVEIEVRDDALPKPSCDNNEVKKEVVSAQRMCLCWGTGERTGDQGREYGKGKRSGHEVRGLPLQSCARPHADDVSLPLSLSLLIDWLVSQKHLRLL